MSSVATTGIGFSLGYPWSGLDYERDHWLLTATSPPSNASELFSPPGPTIYVKGYGRVCYQFDDGGEIYYAPWIPVTISPQIVPMPVARQGRIVNLIQFPEPGVVWNLTEVRTR